MATQPAPWEQYEMPEEQIEAIKQYAAHKVEGAERRAGIAIAHVIGKLIAQSSATDPHFRGLQQAYMAVLNHVDPPSGGR